MKSKTSTVPLPEFFEPMQAKLVASRPTTCAWICEIKFDGYRALALRGGNETRILSRNQKDLGKKFPTIAESISKLAVQDAIIDGEIVALDEQGRSSFQLLQGFDMGTDRPPIIFYAFDLLQLDASVRIATEYQIQDFDVVSIGLETRCPMGAKHSVKI